MKKLGCLSLLVVLIPLVSCNQNKSKYIDVASYVDSTGNHDCSDKIQQLINKNPNRTLYFRDGTYLLDHQILTPGDPKRSVDLQLSNYAILKASDNYQIKRTGEWDPEYQDEYLYMVSLGGLDRDKVDVLLCPTCPDTACDVGSKVSDPLSMYLMDIGTITANLAGIPGISIPCGFDADNMPVGMQLLAQTLNEKTLLNIANVFQQNTDFHNQFAKL